MNMNDFKSSLWELIEHRHTYPLQPSSFFLCLLWQGLFKIPVSISKHLHFYLIYHLVSLHFCNLLLLRGSPKINFSNIIKVLFWFRVFSFSREGSGHLLALSLDNLGDKHNQTLGSRYYSENHKGNIFLLTSKPISEVFHTILLMAFPGVSNLICVLFVSHALSFCDRVEESVP